LNLDDHRSRLVPKAALGDAEGVNRPAGSETPGEE
jgi:hypothetical protein